MGHWAGLGHVFSATGSCDDEGDGVPDTPAQAEPTGGCPAAKDSCPAQPGGDSINNFMDYSDDACMTRFTPGQIARMHAVLLTYRPLLVAAAANVAPRRLRPRPRPRRPVRRAAAGSLGH